MENELKLQWPIVYANLRQLRILLNISSSRFASLSGVCDHQLRRLERHEITAADDVKERVIAALRYVWLHRSIEHPLLSNALHTPAEMPEFPPVTASTYLGEIRFSPVPIEIQIRIAELADKIRCARRYGTA